MSGCSRRKVRRNIGGIAGARLRGLLAAVLVSALVASRTPTLAPFGCSNSTARSGPPPPTISYRTFATPQTRRCRVVRHATRYAGRSRSVDARHDQGDSRVEDTGRDLRRTEWRRAPRAPARTCCMQATSLRWRRRRTSARRRRSASAATARRSRCPARSPDPDQRQEAGQRRRLKANLANAPPRRRHGSTMERKVVNDAVAYIRGLAELRGRNKDWAEKTRARSVEPAGVGRTRRTRDRLHRYRPRRSAAPSSTAARSTIDGGNGDARLERRRTSRASSPAGATSCCRVITDPNVAYILLMIGIYGLILEFYHPGTAVPGRHRRDLPAARRLRAADAAGQLRRSRADRGRHRADGRGSVHARIRRARCRGRHCIRLRFGDIDGHGSARVTRSRCRSSPPLRRRQWPSSCSSSAPRCERARRKVVTGRESMVGATRRRDGRFRRPRSRATARRNLASGVAHSARQRTPRCASSRIDDLVLTVEPRSKPDGDLLRTV